MKSLREHLSEALADRNGVPKKFNKNLHAKMVHYARGHISAVADDIEQGVNDTARMLGKHNAGSVYHGVEDHLADHLHDTFHRHPGYNDGGQGISLARHVSKKVTAQYIHDDRPEYRAAVRKHDRAEKISNTKREIAGRSTEDLLSNKNWHRGMKSYHVGIGTPDDMKHAKHHSQMIKYHNDEFKSRGVLQTKARSRATSTPTAVNVWTKSGTIQRTMKLPPFRKA